MNLSDLKITLKKTNDFLEMFEIQNGYLILPPALENICPPLWIRYYDKDVPFLERMLFNLFHTFQQISDDELSLSQEELAQELGKLDFYDIQTVIDQEENNKQTNSNKTVNQLKTNEIVSNLMATLQVATALIHNYMSVMMYRRPIHEILDSNNSENSTNLLCLIRIDKSFIHDERVQKLILQAQLTGDSKLLSQLSNTLSRPSFSSKIKYPKVFFAYYILEREGFLKDGKFIGIKYRELLDLLEDCQFFSEIHYISSEKKLQKHFKEYIKMRSSPL